MTINFQSESCGSADGSFPGARVLRVAAIACDTPMKPVADVYGDYETIFRRQLEFAAAYLTKAGTPCGVIVEPFDARIGRLPTPADGHFDLFLLSGSKASAFADLPWIHALKQWLRDADHVFPRTAVMGICFGLQVLTEAFGGRVARHENGWEIGTIEITLNADAAAVFTRRAVRAGDVVQLQSIHEDHVVRVPDRFVNLGATPHSPVQMMASRDGRFFCTQSHPEFTSDMIDIMIKVRRGDSIPASVVDAALARSAMRNDGLWILTEMLTRAMAYSTLAAAITPAVAPTVVPEVLPAVVPDAMPAVVPAVVSS